MAFACGPAIPTHATVDANHDRIIGLTLRAGAIKVIPPPNPPFIFPSQPSISPAPSRNPRTTARRPMSAIEPSAALLSCSTGITDRRPDTVQLPDFSFNPGAGLKHETANLLNLPSAPFPAKPAQFPSSPSRPPGGHRHRRGGSEFVGGSIRMGDTITVMSFIPNKEGPSSLSANLPPSHRRGHTRNRSANPSMGGTMALQPIDGNSLLLRGTSAPTSPSDVAGDENAFTSMVTKSPAVTVNVSTVPMQVPAQEDPNPNPIRRDSDDKPAIKSRVGFSDTLEYIPRPISLVSTDTSSTATVRPGHSLSGSVSSLISMSNSIVECSPSPALSRSTTLERSNSRPSTAGAVLDRALKSLEEQSTDSPRKRRNSIPALVTTALDAPSTTESSPSKAPKRWSFFGLEPFSSSSSPTRSRPTSSGSNDLANTCRSSASSSSDHVADVTPPQPTAAATQIQTGRPGKAKKKVVKKWAGAILTRKAKPRAHKSAENLSTAAHTHADPELLGITSLIAPQPAVHPPMPLLTVTEPRASPHDAEISRPVSAPSPEDDVSYPVIDLDAALGPFNTPLPINPEWEAAQQSTSQPTKRPLHSAQGMKGFSGPGMHYHRRTESAPEMAPFEALRGGLHRFSSRSTMADVFEEDEEENDYSPSEATASRVNLSETPRASLPETVSSVESDEEDGGVTPPAISEPMKQLMVAAESKPPKWAPEQGILDVPIARVRKERSTPSLRREIVELAGPIAFRTSNLFMSKTDGDSTCSSRRKDLYPVDISPLHTPPAYLPPPQSHCSNSHSSWHPSPRSPMSYDGQILPTAPSSVNEDSNFQSLLRGEPGPEVRISVDDVPSLTSSTSGTTRDSMFGQNLQMFQAANDQQRPVSLSGPFGRRRSSLVSLGRLISSSHGERSKLSTEVSYDDGEEDKRPKSSRARRLSRLMQFWKPKEAKNINAK